MSDAEPEAGNDTGVDLRRRIIIYAVALLAAFLIGLIPMWMVARGRANDRDAAHRELRICRLESRLLSAAVESRRGEYERARVAASDFFSSLREHVDQASERSDLTQEQAASLRPLLDQRDDLITLLARSDPASADRLSELYVSFAKGMGNKQQ